MVFSLAYRRPARVAAADAETNEKLAIQDESIKSGSTGASRGIPDALSFDRILSGGTCPPCTVRDFMNYLLYIEHAAENLQFYIWYKDYVQRFEALSEKDKALSPAWTPHEAELAIQKARAAAKAAKKVDMSQETETALKGTTFANGVAVTLSENGTPIGSPGNPFDSTPVTADDRTERTSMAPGSVSDIASSRATKASTTAAQAFENADLKWQPFTIQPFREEINRIIATYISEQSPRELNMSGQQRIAVLNALEHTTHPSALANLLTTVEYSLRTQAHPNFIRWTICNGNRPRVFFARFLGIFGIVGGLVALIVLTLSKAGRGWRALSAIGFVIGIATLIAAWKGMCVVLHGMHHRHLRPWELFEEMEDEEESDSQSSIKKVSMDSIGSKNSYETEPWVVAYEKRNIIRKIFDRETWIEEPALRQIQDTIFIQSILGAVIISGITVGIFMAIPKGNLF